MLQIRQFRMHQNWRRHWKIRIVRKSSWGGNIEINQELDVKRTVTLDLNGYTLSCSSTDEDMFLVRSSGNLTVKDSGNSGKIDGRIGTADLMSREAC